MPEYLYYSESFSEFPTEPNLPWLTRWATEIDLQIPSTLKNNVVFLGTMENDKFRPRATAFLVGYKGKYGDLLHLVTAEHVIANLRMKGLDHVYLRTNSEGFPISKLPLDRWYFHPESRKNTHRRCIDSNSNTREFTRYSCSLYTAAFVTKENIENREWGVGDEVVVIGLFRNHYGHAKNIPIVRIGNLSALPDEPVKTNWGYIEAYLVELHSIGGLSGSPVYIHHPPFRIGT